MVSSLKPFGREFESLIIHQNPGDDYFYCHNEFTNVLYLSSSQPSLPDSNIWESWQCRVLQRSLTLLPSAWETCHLKLIFLTLTPSTFIYFCSFFFLSLGACWPYSDYCFLSQDLICPGFERASSPLVSQNPQHSPLPLFFPVSSTFLFSLFLLSCLFIFNPDSVFSCPRAVPHLTHS